MELKEFAGDFLDSALLSVEADGLSQEDAVTLDILEYLKDSGEVIQPELCNFKIRGVKINAYDYDDDGNSLDLFVTLYKGNGHLAKVSNSDVSDAFGRALNFFTGVRNDKLISKIDESNETVFELAQLLEHTKKSLETVRIFVLTNGLASSDILPPAGEADGIYIEYQLWDIERIFQQYIIRAGKQKIIVDFQTDFNYKLKCLKMDNISDKVDAYLAIIPGKILAAIYKKYRQGLLEKNVRTFLQFKAKVNQGIRRTISEEPDMFFAYNNGISTTAERVELTYDESLAYITRIENLQIVNGGQTTASIFATSSDKHIDLSGVFVQMKISVIKKSANVEVVVPKISRFANSQTAIKDSDFSSNHPYHIAIENFSRSEWVPSLTGGKATNKWFYERTRGQYLDEQSKRTSGSELKKFKIEFPKGQKFTKTDLAKYEMSWWQRPYDVSKGAENNFKLFTKEIENFKEQLGKDYFHRLIAKAILFKEIDRIVYRRALGGYKANMVSYIMALLSYKSNRRLNLHEIWKTQKISEGLNSTIENLIDITWNHITNPSRPGMNIGEWCKKAECWITLKDKYVDIGSIAAETSEGNAIEEVNEPSLTAGETKLIEDATKIGPQIWFALAKWAKEYNKLSAFDRRLAYNLGVLSNRKTILSIKQAKNALRILEAAEKEGFTPSDQT